MDSVLILVLIGIFFLVVSVVLLCVVYRETGVPRPQRGQTPVASSQPKKWTWAWVTGAVLSFIISIVAFLYAYASVYKPLAQMFSLTPSFGKESPTYNCTYNGFAIVPTSDLKLAPDDKVESFFIQAYSLKHNTVEFKTMDGRYLRGHLRCVPSGEKAMSFMIEKSREHFWKQTEWTVQSSTRTLEECKTQIQKLNSLGSHYLAGVKDCRVFAALFGTFLSTC